MAAFSLSKDKIRILLLEGVNDSAVALLRAAGYSQIVRHAKALDGAALTDALHGVHILGIRSRTQLTEAVFAAANRLMVVGCFSVGTNQVELDAARSRGIPVFNAPFSNTRSVAELVIGEIVMLLRRVTPRSAAAHQGIWDKSATNSFEVRGKTLGIVGYGSIGSQLSTLAEAMGMRVLYYDVIDKLRHGNTEPVASLEELLRLSDVVSLHVPETAATAGMIGAAQLAMMKPGAYLINNSRGTVVDLDALRDALKSGPSAWRCRGCFPGRAGRRGRPLRDTAARAAQRDPHPAYWRVNRGGAGPDRAGGGAPADRLQRRRSHPRRCELPAGAASRRAAATRYIHIHHNVPGMLGRINGAFSGRGVNISGQYLQTDGDLGYVVVETASDEGCDACLAELRSFEGTIRARLIPPGVALLSRPGTRAIQRA